MVSHGIRATFLGTSQRDTNIETKIKQGQFDLVCVTPEKFFDRSGNPSAFFRHLIDSWKIGLIAIDEAHLIATWKSFRYAFITCEI